MADKLIRHIETPVLLIRPREDHVADVTQQAPPFTHVQVALDGSERAERAVAPAIALAGADSARITLVRAAAFSMSATPPDVIPLTGEELRRQEEEARAYLELKARELKG